MTKRTTIIIGLGVTGLSCVRYLHHSDHLIVLDTRDDPPGSAALRGEFPGVAVHLGVTAFDFSAADRVLVSPGVGLDDQLIAALPADLPLVSDIDLFCEAANAPVIAVTGTNGKSTVTSLVGHLLRSIGVRAVAGGNLGEPALDLLDSQAQAYVLELSSFQLERMAPQHFKAATILNISEDHLDRHGDLEAYVQAKQRIYLDCELALWWREDPATRPAEGLAAISFGADEPQPGDWGVRDCGSGRWLACGDRNLLDSRELPVAGRHNELNVLAALALVDSLQPIESNVGSLIDGVKRYRGLRHRCERVGYHAEVEYINDSKATNVGATLAALNGFGQAGPGIVLIAGGDGKGADFSPLRDPVQRFVKAVILLGRDSDLLAAALLGVAEICQVATMGEAVAEAVRLAQPGDLVLLSPACASLDMYRNFEARGDDFVARVELLAA